MSAKRPEFVCGARLLAIAIAIAIAALTACGGGSNDGSNADAIAPPPPPAPPPPSSPVTLAVERVFSNLALTSPVAMLQSPGDTTRWYVVEQSGRVLVFGNSPGITTADTFVDIRGRVSSGGETGLLGLAFHPDFPTNPHLYLSYTASTGGGLVSRISEFTGTGSGIAVDAGTERVLLTIQQPENNHKGGQIAFGPDGFLYAGFGDGGGANDQHGAIGNAQLLTTLLGKMLRIDVAAASASAPYRIPSDNPFAGNPPCGSSGSGAQSCPEIYAFGFRNPWRWSFDRQSGQLWVGDVGQSAREEIDRVAKGGNYGWRCLEGTLGTGFECGTQAARLPPVAEYGRDAGQSVTGGFVYRGAAIPALIGRYVFGDFGSGRLWNIAGDAAPTQAVSGGLQSGLSISSFAEGLDGEIYVIDYRGALYRLRAP